MIYPQHDEVCQPDSPDLSVKDLTFPLLSFLPPIAERKKEKKKKMIKKKTRWLHQCIARAAQNI